MSELLTSLKSEWNLAQGSALARVPLYHQLYSVLKESILNGTIEFDAQMPTEQQLAATFDVRVSPPNGRWMSLPRKT